MGAAGRLHFTLLKSNSTPSDPKMLVKTRGLFSLLWQTKHQAIEQTFCSTGGVLGTIFLADRVGPP